MNPSLPPTAMGLVSLGHSAAGDAPLVVRNCLFDAGDLTLNVEDGDTRPVVVERCYFKTAKLFLGGPRCHNTVARHNVCDDPRGFVGIYAYDVSEVTGILELSNNTTVNCTIKLGEVAPQRGVVLRNNIAPHGIHLGEKPDGVLKDALQNWQFGHNGYAPDSTLLVAPSDVIGWPIFMSSDPADRNFVRIPADSPLAKGGAGGDVPDYIGALPPGAAPKEGDWFTRLRERWLPVVSDGVNASEKIPPGSDVAGNRTVSAGTAALSDAERPFVLIRASGQERKEFKRFAEAVATLRDGDVIEVHGNGPYTVPAVRLEGKGLVIRAAAGYRPIFIASKSVPQNEAWFEIQGGPLTLEGCDFHAEEQFFAFRGGGAPWAWRNCRFFTGPGALVETTGGRLAISDSLIWSGGVAIRSKSHADLELHNNIVRCVSHGIMVERASGEKIALTRNTILSGLHTWLVPDVQDGAEPLEINAEANIFDLRSGAALLGHNFGKAPTPLDAYQNAVRWRGRENLYCGTIGPAVHAKDEGRKVEGLAAWREFWNTEETGSIETPELSFTWDSARVLPTPEAIAWLHGVVERAKQKEANALPELGPDWDMIGPGDAYVRTLAAREQPVAAANLRPEAPDEGPFVVLREGQPIGGRVTLQRAIDEAKSGDTIEIRSDGPFDGATTAHGERGRNLVIRAAPGYLPVLEGVLHCSSMGDVIIQGIHFDGGGTDLVNCVGASHLVNCSFAANARQAPFGIQSSRDTRAASQIVNCWAPGYLHLSQDAGTSISIRNSVVGGCYLHSNGAGQHQLGIERSVMWNPGFGATGAALAFHPQCLFTRQGEGRLTVSLQQTLLETGQALSAAELNEFGWKNAANLYRTGTSNLVERLRAECASGDEGSAAAPPFDFDPRQWRLLPGSPGREAGPGGKDLGADVSRIGVTP